MKYLVVVDSVIKNIIVADESFAAEIGALPYYDGADIDLPYSPPPEPGPSPAEQRAHAYETETIIEWGGDLFTVTEAASLWQYYAAEGSAKADELQALIVAAKTAIREQYSDEDGAAT